MAKKKSTAKKGKAAGTKKLRIGFIGAGGISHAHCNQLKNWDDVEIVAAADVSEDNLTKFKEAFGAEQLFSDWNDMLKQADLDAVSICTPNFLHYQPALDALNAGCHVLVEKPIAMNAREAQEMVDLAKKKKKSLTIAFQYRFDPGTQMIKRAVDSGTLGEIMVAKVHAMRRRGIPNWGVFGRKEMQGGGPMIDLGVHAMEMTHYAMGSPKPVAAVGKTWTYLGDKPSDVASQWPGWDYKTYTVEDLAIGHIRFENGAVMQVEAMFAGHIPPEMEGMKFELIGTKGGATKQPPALYYDKDGTMINATPHFLPKNNMWEVKMRNFVDVVLHGKEDLEPGEHGLMIQKMIDGIYKSAELGKEVKID